MKLKKPLLLFACIIAFIASYAQEDTSLVNVYFHTAKYYLTDRAKHKLKEFIDRHKDDKHLYVVGRCDKWGPLSYNDWLSIMRAKTVADFMAKNGFPIENVDTVKGYGKRKLLAFDLTPKEVDSLNRVVTITGSFAVVKTLVETKHEEPKVAAMVVKKPMPIDTVYLSDSIIVPPPYPEDILAINKHPHKGDILKIERSVEVRNDTPFVMKKLYVAAETMEEPKQDIAVTKPEPAVVTQPVATQTDAAPTVPDEISEDTRASDLTQQVTDKLKNGKVGESLVLRGINFDNGYHTILKKDLPALEAVVAAMKAIPTLKIEIQGHVCCWPLGEEGFDNETKEYNLSNNRAQIVYQYLVEHGIAKDRMTYKGYGMKKPLVYPEKNKRDQYKNRRVEFKIVSK
ncbi:MAG TPA: OmpA family protein [Chitinophagaceae bacterium]|nr:OmpA family protein [Chitinophagaceae bacterium]